MRVCKNTFLAFIWHCNSGAEEETVTGLHIQTDIKLETICGDCIEFQLLDRHGSKFQFGSAETLIWDNSSTFVLIWWICLCFGPWTRQNKHRIIWEWGFYQKIFNFSSTAVLPSTLYLEPITNICMGKTNNELIQKIMSRLSVMTMIYSFNQSPHKLLRVRICRIK